METLAIHMEIVKSIPISGGSNNLYFGSIVPLLINNSQIVNG